MTRGETIQTKIHYKGNNEDFIIFIDDVDTYNKWKTDKTIPLAHFISSFKIFHTNKYDYPSLPLFGYSVVQGRRGFGSHDVNG